MHDLDYGSFQIKSDLGAGPETGRVEVRATCVCGAEVRATAGSFVSAKNEVEARFAQHARAAGWSGGK